MGQLIDWALKKIDAVPSVPFPFLIALLVVFVLVFPTIRRAWKTTPEEKPRESLPVIQLDPSGIYTILVNLEIQMANAQREIGELASAVSDVRENVERLARRRPGKPGKTRKSGSGES